MTEKIAKVYENIPFLPLENSSNIERKGAQFLSNLKQLQVGFGAQVFRVDRDGMWAGAEDFASAPFSVDWQGNMVASSVSLAGYIPTGDALADIGAGNITGTYIANGAIITDKLAANAVVASKIAAGTITTDKLVAGTMTGFTIQTSASGERIVMSGSTIKSYDSSNVLRLEMAGNNFYIYNGSANLAAAIFSSSSSSFVSSQITNGSMFIGAQGTGVVSLTVSGSNYFWASGSLNVNISARDLVSSNSSQSLGTASNPWSAMHSLTVNPQGFINIANISAATASAMSASNGSMYYRTDDHVIRVMINGTWRTVTTS